MNSFLSKNQEEFENAMKKHLKGLDHAVPLLLVNTALQLVQSRLQLLLDPGQMLNLVVGGLKILGGLGGVLVDVLLLLVELVDDLILVGNLVIEGPDGVVSGSLLLAKFLNDNLQVSDIFLDSGGLQLQGFLVIGRVNSGLLSLGQLVSGASQGHLQV